MNLQAFKEGAIDSPGVLVTGTAVGTVTGTGTNLITVTEDLSAVLSAGMKIVVTSGTGQGEVYTVVTAVYDTDHTDITVTEAIGSVIATDTIDRTVAAGTGDSVDHWGCALTASTALSLANLTETASGGSLTTSANIEITETVGSGASLVLTGGAVCEFSGAGAYNGGTITGDCEFSGAMSANTGGTIIGNCTFSGNRSSNDSGGNITGDCVFSGAGSYNTSSTITGNAEFTGTAYSTATTTYFNPQQGTVSGTVTFSGENVTFTLATSESWTVDASSWVFTNGTPTWIFSGVVAYNAGTIIGNCEFSGAGSYNSGTITGDCEFSGAASYNNSTVTGDCEFSGAGSYNINTVVGYCTFSGVGSYNSAGALGDCEFSGAGSYTSGFVSGDCVFSGDGSYSGTGGIGPSTITIAGPNVYLDSTGTITGCRVEIAAQPDLAAANILAGKTILGVEGSFDEAARNTDPTAAKVLTGTAYKIANVAKTGTRVDCPANKALTTSGNYGNPASPTVGTNVLPATADVRAGVAVGVSPAVGTLDIEADNPPIGNQGLAMGL